MILDRSYAMALSYDNYTNDEGIVFVFDTPEPANAAAIPFDYNNLETLFANCVCIMGAKKHERNLNRIHMIHNGEYLPVKGVGRYNEDPDKYLVVPDTIIFSVFNNPAYQVNSTYPQYKLDEKGAHLFINDNPEDYLFNTTYWSDVTTLDGEYVEYDLGMDAKVVEFESVRYHSQTYVPGSAEIQYWNGTDWIVAKTFVPMDVDKYGTVTLDTPIIARKWRYVVRDTGLKSILGFGLRFVTDEIPAGNPTHGDPKWFIYIPMSYSSPLVNHLSHQHPIIFGSASGPDKESNLTLSAVGLEPAEQLRIINLKFDFQTLGVVS